MSNEALKNHLAKLENLRISAKSKDDVSNIVQEVKEYSKSGTYSFRQPFIIYLIFISLFLLLITLAYDPSDPSDSELPLGGTSLLFFLGSVFAFFYNRSRVSSVGKRLGHTVIALENGLVPSSAFNGRELWIALRKQFNLFRAGDEGQIITSMYDGQTTDGTLFQVFEFKYVDVSEQEEEDSDGNKTTRKTETVCYKYGVLTHLPSLPLMTINTRNGVKEKWDSASKAFNKKFKIRCSNPVEAAKFFTPACVIKFEESYQTLLSLDMTPNSYICISTDKSVFPTNSKVPKINEKSEFLAYLQEPPKLKDLDVIKEFISYVNSRNIIKKEAV